MANIEFDRRTSDDSQSGCLSLLFPLLIISVTSFVWYKYGFITVLGSVASMVGVFILIILGIMVFAYIKDKKDEKQREIDINNFKIENTEEKNYETIYKEILKDALRIENSIARNISAQNWNGSLYLGISISATIGIIGFLIYYSVVFTNASTDWLGFAIFYFPKLTLTVFAQLFAFYFLRLYQSTRNEKKYYLNELSNIQYKIIGLKIAIFQRNNEALNKVIDSFLYTEKNANLKSGETNLQIENLKQDNETMRSIIDKLPNPSSIKEIK